MWNIQEQEKWLKVRLILHLSFVCSIVLTCILFCLHILLFSIISIITIGIDECYIILNFTFRARKSNCQVEVRRRCLP